MDILTLLVILIGVVTLMWIVASYMEIEKLKITVNGYKTENEVNQPVGEVATPFDEINRVWGNFAERLKNQMGSIVNGDIPELEEDKIYYLCYPCTTGGRSIEENKEREEVLFKRITEVNPEIKIIRPLKIIPNNTKHEEAMKKCFKLMSVADAIILPLGWSKSKGCVQECERAMIKDMERVYLATD